MITSEELHEHGYFELEGTNETVFFSGSDGILLFKNGGGYIPHFFDSHNMSFIAGKQFTELNELEGLKP
jgi:hypothetical protein